jgi:hypothetical protein
MTSTSSLRHRKSIFNTVAEYATPLAYRERGRGKTTNFREGKE